MIACPSKTRFSRVLPSGAGVRSIIAGIRPFAIWTISILYFQHSGHFCCVSSNIPGRDEKRGAGHVAENRSGVQGRRRKRGKSSTPSLDAFAMT
jgi:hypothetical protein